MPNLKPVDHDPFADTQGNGDPARLEAAAPAVDKRHVLVIRHGSTALNGQNGKGPDRIRGWKNVPLSGKGKLEVANTAQDLKGSGIEILVHSDLDRAGDTAKAIARTTGAEMVPTKALRPWDLGHFTGKESNAVQGELRPYVHDHPDKIVPNGESFNQFKLRVFQGVADAIAHAGGRKLALVTHHRVERLLQAWIDAGEPADLTIKPETMFHHGDAPASVKGIVIDVRKLPAAGQRQNAMTSTTVSMPSGKASSRASASE